VNLAQKRRNRFGLAAEYAQAAQRNLRTLRDDYRDSDLPEEVKAARLRALDGKIAALGALGLDPDAHPWGQDR